MDVHTHLWVGWMEVYALLWVGMEVHTPLWVGMEAHTQLWVEDGGICPFVGGDGGTHPFVGGGWRYTPICGLWLLSTYLFQEMDIDDILRHAETQNFEPQGVGVANDLLSQFKVCTNRCGVGVVDVRFV